MALASLSSQAGELTSDLGGRVVDASGKPIAGAVMIVTHVETGRVTHHRTGTTGRWRASNVRADGRYRIECIAPSMETAATFEGRVLLGMAHTRNCVIGTLGAQSPHWLYSWSWKQSPHQAVLAQHRK
ncbi:carboxypeptidase-like regulatory domain-containing protein [Pseudoxanthomonas mexicana]